MWSSKQFVLMSIKLCKYGSSVKLYLVYWRLSPTTMIRSRLKHTCALTHILWTLIMAYHAVVTILASAPFQGHARLKQNKHDYSEQILKSVSNFSPPTFTTYGNDLHLTCLHFYTKKMKTWCSKCMLEAKHFSWLFFS